MKDGLRLWWSDQKEMWRLAKRHPILFTLYMIVGVLILKWIGL